jgi:methoxymalonate biosynthesis acyl carrier protein
VSETLDLTARISELFLEAVEIEVEAPDQDLIENGLLDSLTFVEILLHIEREFGVDVGLVGFEIDDFRTVENIGEFVQRHKPEPA